MRTWNLIGLLATAVIAVALPVYAFNETNRMTTTQTHLLKESVGQGRSVGLLNQGVDFLMKTVQQEPLDRVGVKMFLTIAV
jgi:hypothetical protein